MFPQSLLGEDLVVISTEWTYITCTPVTRKKKFCFYFIDIIHVEGTP